MRLSITVIFTLCAIASLALSLHLAFSLMVGAAFITLGLAFGSFVGVLASIWV